jgi:hypothetical protein
MAMENKMDSETASGGQTGRKPWTSPDLIFSDISDSTEKLSSTSEFFVPEFNRTLGPS